MPGWPRKYSTTLLRCAAPHRGQNRKSSANAPEQWAHLRIPVVVCPRRGRVNPLRDDAVDREHLGVLAVHVDAVRARDVPDVLRIRVAPVLLRGVLLQRRHLALEMPLLERDVPLVGEVEVVPRDLVPEDGRALERAQAFLCDRLVVLVDVVEAR